MNKLWKRSVSWAITAVLLIQLTAAAFAAGLGGSVLTDKRTYTDGFTYEKSISYADDGSRVVSFTVTAAPTAAVRPIVMACDTIYGGLTITQCTAYAEALGYNVIGGINADFGYWSTRIPCGVVVEDGIYKSSPEQCNALALTADGGFVSMLPEVVTTLEHDGGEITLTHFNKTREETGGLYLYSEHFSTVSTRTSGEGWAIRLRILEGEMTLSGEEMLLEVEEKYEGEEAVSIGEGCLILTAADESGLEDVFGSFEEGDTVRLWNVCSDERLSEAEWVTGCGNILLYDGEVYEPGGWDSSIAGKNPRTCVGIQPDGTLIFRVVDGRSADSAGATLMQLAQEFRALGCVEAVNLDGGGSSVLTLREPGKTGQALQNTPSDGALRAVPSYILFVTETESDGTADRLFLEQDGTVILTGSSLPLRFTAMDAALMPADVPADTAAESTTGLGRVDENGMYRAADEPGTETLLLGSVPAVPADTGTLHVSDRADTLTVLDTETGRAPAELLRPDEGGTISFSVSAKYEGRPVTMDPEAVTYTVEGDVGTVDENGTFTASNIWGAEGMVTAAAAGLAQSFRVRVGAVFDDIGKHWARRYIEALHTAGVVNGVTETSFAPDAPMKRGDFMLMLHRAAGCPEPVVPEPEETDEPKKMPEFGDVPETAYYAAAVKWAASVGIAQGTGDGLFRPGDTLTREQAFAFAVRALPVLGLSVPEADLTVLEDFSDADRLHGWSEEAAAALVGMGIIEGSEGKLTPQVSLTRSQMAKILCLLTE
ncbi:MAG: S-layer homology domain-containing protein [Eubacteriales bacterium]|nr:S-layer homology domain-containing protein [Eubacteriales bacterium]